VAVKAVSHQLSAVSFWFLPVYQEIAYKPFQNQFFGHPERHEGSQRVENTRFFAPLRMTIPYAGRF
jgi:hypothetical protein